MPTYSSNDQGVHVNFQFWLFKESFLRIESSKARKGIWHLYHKVFILNSPSAEDHKTLYHSCQPSVRSYLEYATFIRVYKTLISFLQHLLNEEAEEKKKKNTPLSHVLLNDLEASRSLLIYLNLQYSSHPSPPHHGPAHSTWLLCLLFPPAPLESLWSPESFMFHHLPANVHRREKYELSERKQGHITTDLPKKRDRQSKIWTAPDNISYSSRECKEMFIIFLFILLMFVFALSFCFWPGLEMEISWEKLKIS